MSGRAWAVVPMVKDGGGFFTPETLTKANQEIANIQKQYKKDLLIETFATVPTDKVDAVKKMTPKERTRFFQGWANERARAERVEGIYILISKEPAHLQIEVGHETEKRAFKVPDDVKRLRTILLENFQKKDYDTGLLEGVEFVQQKLSENLGVARAAGEAPARANEPVAHKVGPEVQGVSGMGFLWIIVVLLIGFWILRALFRGIFHMLGGGGPRQYGPGPGAPGPGYGGTRLRRRPRVWRGRRWRLYERHAGRPLRRGGWQLAL